MTQRTNGHPTSGTPIDDDLIEKLADEAEDGYDVDQLVPRRERRSRPQLGSAPASVEKG